MISICLTNFNRYEMLFESFAQVYDDPRISEIIISDDCSDYAIYQKIQDRVQDMPKVKLSRTDTNVGCYRNKRRAVSLATNEWVIIFDSDNIMGVDYIDAIYNISDGFWCNDWVLQPIFAKPHFNFSKYEKRLIQRENISNLADDATLCTALNAMNYFVNRDEYLRVWDENMNEPWTADSIYHNMRWLEAGNFIYFCPGLTYEHRVDSHKEHMSHYKEHHRKTGNLYNEVVNKLKAMR